MNIPVVSNKTNLKIPVIGLGTWGMGGKMEQDPQNNDARDIEVIRQAISSGITHIDTAELYAAGHSERLVAQAMADVPREKILLASKVLASHLAYDDVLKACEGSLERLNVDYLDLYYIHARNLSIPLQETARALNALLHDGLIRHIGVCNFSAQSMKDLQPLLDAPIAVNQSHYSLVYREPEREGLLEHCAQVGATFLAWRPVMWCDPTRNDQPAGSAWDRGVYPILDEIADVYGKPNVQVALNWLINQPNVCALVKTSQAGHLQELLGCLTWHLSSSDIETLRKSFSDQRDISCAAPLR